MADQKLTQRSEVIVLDDDDLIHVVTDPAGSPTTQKITKLNLSSSIFLSRRLISVNSRPGSTSVDTFGHAAITAYADASANADNASGPFIRRDTAASSGTTAGFDFNNGSLIQTRWTPVIVTKFMTGSDISSQRFWTGSFSVGAGSFTDDPTAHGFGLRYSTNASDTTFKAWTNDNSGGGLITDTGVTVVVDTVYIVLFLIESASSIKFYLSSDNGVSFTLVATHAANLPLSSTAMNHYFDLRTLTAGVRSIKHGFTTIRMA